MHLLAKNLEFRRKVEERRQAILANPEAHLEHEIEWATHPDREKPLWLVDLEEDNPESYAEAREAILRHHETVNDPLLASKHHETLKVTKELEAAGIEVDKRPPFHRHEIEWALGRKLESHEKTSVHEIEPPSDKMIEAFDAFIDVAFAERVEGVIELAPGPCIVDPFHRDPGMPIEEVVHEMDEMMKADPMTFGADFADGPDQTVKLDVQVVEGVITSVTDEEFDRNIAFDAEHSPTTDGTHEEPEPDPKSLELDGLPPKTE
jgi:hypothetical protein